MPLHSVPVHPHDCVREADSTLDEGVSGGKSESVGAQLPEGVEAGESIKTDYSSDLSLMRLVAAADRTAQKELIDRLGGRIGRLCSGMFRGHADLKDLVQASLLEVLESAPSYRGVGPLERWADRIAIRRSLKMVVRARAHSGNHHPDMEPDELDESLLAIDHGLPRRLEQYMEALPQDLSTLLMMRHVYGYTMKEISEQTETSINTIKKRLARANQLVRRLIQRDRLVE